MQKKIRELESKLDVLSNQVNGNINSIRKNLLQINDSITDLKIGEERNIRNIKVIKNMMYIIFVIPMNNPKMLSPS